MKTENIYAISYEIAEEVEQACNLAIEKRTLGLFAAAVYDALDEIFNDNSGKTGDNIFGSVVNKLRKNFGDDGAGCVILGLFDVAFKKKLLRCLEGHLTSEPNGEIYRIGIKVSSIEPSEGVSVDINLIPEDRSITDDGRITDLYVKIGVNLQ